MKAELERALRSALRSVPTVGKTGESHLKQAVRDSLTAIGLIVDVEDRPRQFLRPGMPAWRSRDTRAVETTQRRLKIDLVAYDGADPVALVETESDLDDLRLQGTSRRSGHYDVFSIARSAKGQYFDSYKSLERMAAAALYWYRWTSTRVYPSPADAEALLSAIASDSPKQHNPAALPLFLVSGRCRPSDPAILEPRLRSLGGSLICGRMGRT